MVELKADGSAGARKRSSPSISTTRVADGDGNDVEIVGWRGVGFNLLHGSVLAPRCCSDVKRHRWQNCQLMLAWVTIASYPGSVRVEWARCIWRKTPGLIARSR